MKNLTNILSYLWLLLLMAVTACSDLEEEVGPMHVEEEVELTIQLHVPDMQASTREEMVITENISSIVAIAFDESGDLIKKVDAILSEQNHVSHRGTLKIKVPKRTQTIHFLGNYTKNDIESIKSLETLNNFTTTDDTTMPTMRYWGMTTFDDDSNINQPVTLYRNMAKLTLTKGKNINGSCYIAGFVNRNISGTIVPSGHAVGDTPTIPNNVGKGSYEEDNSLGNVYYLFEHANTKDNPLYIILEILDKYYKVAFASGDTYFPIIRNHEYTITIDGIDAMYAEDSYDAAVKSTYPINDLVIDGVSMTVTASPTEVLNQSGQKCMVTVTIPGGITELNVPTHDDFTIAPPNVLTEQNGKYTVTPDNKYAFTFTVKDGVEAGDKTISFSGRGKYKSATGSATVTLEDNKTVSIVAVPSATTLNYAASSVEDLLVNVTIPKAVTGLTFSSSDFTIKVASGELVAVENEENSYTITHDENATETKVPVRIRLNDNVSSQTASFTFNGTSDDANVEVQSVTKEIALTADGDENVRWQGNVPLSSDNDSIMVPLLYNWFCKSGTANIPINSRLQFEFDVTSDSESYFEITEIRGSSNGWNDPAFSFPELANGYRYDAITSGEGPVIVTMNQGVFDIILENYQSLFLGDTDVAMAIRGAGITLKKVSVLPPTVAITATPYVNSLNYSTNSVSDLIVNVTIPKEVSTLTFASEYFDAAVVVDTLLTAPTNGTYTVVHPNNGNGPTSTSVRLQLKNKTSTTSAGFTFSGTGENVTVTSAVIDNITLTEGGDEYVRWQGDAALQWGINAVQIPLLYSWFYDANNQLIIPVGSTLRVEYETLGNDASIQFAECKGTWNDDAYYFSELHSEYNNNGNNETMGLNLDNNTGIYNGTSKDLVLTQAVLDNMKENRTNLLGENDIVMAIQGGNVTLKKISVIPATENPSEGLNITLDFYTKDANGNKIDDQNNNYTNLALGSSQLFLTATILSEDAQTYSGEQVQLQGQYLNTNGDRRDGWAIDWGGSKRSGGIRYGNDNNGTVLQFTIQEGVTEYLIEWVFQTGNYYAGYGDIQFDYSLSNNQGYTLSGNSSATIAFTNEPVALWTGERALEWSENYLRVDKQIPTGSVVTLNFTSTGGSFKLHEQTGGADIIALPGINYGDNNNLGIISVNSGVTSYSFDVTNEIKVNGNNINGYLNGLAINGSGVTMTSIVVKYPDGYVEEEEVIVNIDFRTYNQWTLWCEPNDREPTVDSTNGFCLSNPEKCSNNWEPQYHLADGLTLGAGTYTITMKIRGSVAGQIDRVGLGSWDTGQTYSSSAMTFTTAWQENTVEVEVEQATAQGAGFVMCQSGSFIGDLYIQTLKVVKTSQ